MSEGLVRLTVAIGTKTAVLEVPRGSTVSEALRGHGILVDTPCGGRGRCGKCTVQLTGAVSEPGPTERERLGDEALARGSRLACLATLEGEARAELAGAGVRALRILERGTATPARRGGSPAFLDPAVSKEYRELVKPTLEDPQPDWERIIGSRVGLRRPTYSAVDPAVLRLVPTVLRRDSFQATVVRTGGEIIAVEAGDTRNRLFGAAFDIGTTSIVGTLIDLGSGRRLAVVSRTNPQVAFGADVISRITHAQTATDGLGELQRAVASALSEMLAELAGEAGIRREEIYEVVLVGNTTMQHLALGVSPANLAVSPYVPAFQGPVRAHARDLGLDLPAQVPVYVAPNIAGFVGADTVAVTLATALHHSGKVRLAVDLGTNGEIVLGDRQGFSACSAAAGPAFEGAHIRHGMRGTPGAIESVSIGPDGDLELGVIGEGKAAGICGSGLLDAVAVLRQAGLLQASGRLKVPDGQATPRPDTRLATRLREGPDGLEFVLAWPEQSSTGEAIVLTQRDIREFQLAKGAIAAGIAILMERRGVGIDDIEEVLLAGAFGTYLRRESALAVGLIPPVPASRVRAVGNAALAGAELMLISRKARRDAERISRMADYVELGTRPEFMDRFTESMFFPETV